MREKKQQLDRKKLIQAILRKDTEALRQAFKETLPRFYMCFCIDKIKDKEKITYLKQEIDRAEMERLVHEAQQKYNVQVHIMEFVSYADGSREETFSFEPDSRIRFVPAPGCEPLKDQ